MWDGRVSVSSIRDRLSQASRDQAGGLGEVRTAPPHAVRVAREEIDAPVVEQPPCGLGRPAAPALEQAGRHNLDERAAGTRFVDRAGMPREASRSLGMGEHGQQADLGQAFHDGAEECSRRVGLHLDDEVAAPERACGELFERSRDGVAGPHLRGEVEGERDGRHLERLAQLGEALFRLAPPGCPQA